MTGRGNYHRNILAGSKLLPPVRAEPKKKNEPIGHIDAGNACNISITPKVLESGQCPLCPFKWNRKRLSNYYTHLKRVHRYDATAIGNIKKELNVRPKVKSKNEDKADETSASRFDSKEKYKIWMEEQQQDSCTSWRVESSQKDGNKIVTKYRCHRSRGNSVYTKSRSCVRMKLPMKCPVRAKVTQFNNGEVLVDAVFEHNHEVNPALSRLLESEKTLLKSLLSDNCLDNVRVKEKLKQISLHENSRLKYLHVSHIGDLRRHWGFLKYQRSTDIESSENTSGNDVHLTISDISDPSSVKLPAEKYGLASKFNDFTKRENVEKAKKMFCEITEELFMNNQNPAAKSLLQRICQQFVESTREIHTPIQKPTKSMTSRNKFVPCRIIDPAFGGRNQKKCQEKEEDGD